MAIPPKRTKVRAVIDAISELTGVYRLAALRRRCLIHWTARVKSPSRLQLGTGVIVQAGAIVHCGGKAWSAHEGYVALGDGVAIGPHCILYGAGGIELGDHVHLGPDVKMMTQAGRHDVARLGCHPSYSFAPISVGAGSWIGAGAVLLGGATVGRCVNVAPNAVVSGVIPDFSVVAGNPGRIVMKHEAVK